MPDCTCRSFPDRVCYCHLQGVSHKACKCKCPVGWPTRPDHRKRDDKCPPHFFVATSAWDGESSQGFIFCRWCAEILELHAANIEAPAEERIEDSADVHPPK